MEKDPIFAEAERLYMLENPGGCLAAEDETVKRYWMGKAANGESYTGVSVYWIEQWSQIWGRCNWYTFNPLLIEFEDERIMGGVEFTLIILGLGFRVRWNYKETDEAKAIISAAAELSTIIPER